MDRIKQSGKLTVGVKVDYRPFGYRNEKGEMLGLEHDLVADIASRLSTKFDKNIEVEKVVVTAQNRMQFLQQGRIDLMRKRDERSSVEVGRAPWWSVTGGCNEHEFFDEHYARRQTTFLERLGNKRCLEFKCLETF